MKNLMALTLLIGSSAFAVELSCAGNGERFTINVQSDKIIFSQGYGTLTTDPTDPDCSARSGRYACYVEGQLMVHIPLALTQGYAKSGNIYIQSDTDDNTNSDNVALLGAPYRCTAD